VIPRPGPLRERLSSNLRRGIAATLLAGVVLAAGCESGTSSASFDVAAGCPTEGRAVGAYPDLEARIPTAYEGRGPDRLDSGRHCSRTSLGSLADAGFDEVRFAGGTWDLGGYRAAALVVFEAPGLTADDVAEFYRTSALGANRTRILAEDAPVVAGRAGHRLDTRTGDRLQTVVVWPADEDGTVDVVITNDLPDPKIQAAIDAFGGR
jgi:hypothetical protein